MRGIVEEEEKREDDGWKEKIMKNVGGNRGRMIVRSEDKIGRERKEDERILLNKFRVKRKVGDNLKVELKIEMECWKNEEGLMNKWRKIEENMEEGREGGKWKERKIENEERNEWGLKRNIGKIGWGRNLMKGSIWDE